MENKKLTTMAVGAVILYVAYNFWFGSGIFDGVYVPSPPEGFDNLEGALKANDPQALRSVGVSDFISQALEIVATIISTVGMVGIAISTKLIQWISGSFNFGGSETSSAVANSVLETDDEEFEVMLLVLGQAVIRKNRKLTIAVAEQMAQSSFLTDELEVSSEVETFFPSSDDDA